MKLDESLFFQCRRLMDQLKPTQLPFHAGELEGNRVLIVDGDLVKIQPDKTKDDTSHMDFVEGGNDLESSWVRREFGKHVFILDSNLARHDWPFVLYHEAHERRLMAQGWSYAKAHEDANKAERELRIRRRMVQGAANG